MGGSPPALSKLSGSAIVVILVVTGLFFQPYGPYNSISGSNFHLKSVTSVNMTIFNSLERVISLIPPTEPHVLIQNNIVEALPGPVGKVLLVPQYNVGPNVTIADIIANRFPTLEGNIIGTSPINYAIADLNDQNTLLQYGNPGFPNMIGICQMLLSSHYYGIRAEESNIILIQRGYSGPIAFSPYNASYGANLFHSDYGSLAGGLMAVTDPPNQSTLWYGPYTSPFAAYISVVPGTYKITVDIGLQKNNASGSIQLKVAYMAGKGVLNTTFVNMTNAVNSEGGVSAEVLFTTGNLISSLEFDATSEGFSGTLYLKKVSLVQMGPPEVGVIGGIIGMIGDTPNQVNYIVASSSLGNYTAANAIDSNLSTAWISTNYTANLNLGFTTVENISGVSLALGSYPSSDFNITLKLFNSTSYAAYGSQHFITGGVLGFTVVTITFKTFECNQLQIYCTSPVSLIRINEITIIDA